MKSKKNENKSVTEANENQESASVFDFLYHDNRRIASFLAQFEAVGHLQQISQIDSTQKGEKEETRTSGNVNIPGTLGLKRESEREGSASFTEGSTRIYDPFWANARRFLDLLEERELIRRDLETASIGQFVLATGFLGIQDLAMFKEAWKLSSIQRQVKSGSSGKKISNMTAAQRLEAKSQQENSDLMLDMLQILPHAIHARMLTRQNENTQLIWCTLKEEYLVAPASDIMLTYGETMSGKWSIIGILSAHPEYLTPDLSQQFDSDDLGFTQSVVGQLTKVLAPVVRVTLGRPAAAHAITPLLIFRDVT